MAKLLLVDDDSSLLTALTQLLKKNNFEIQTLNNPNNIFDTISSYHPDLIILDVMMAGEDGRDVCLQLKENPVTAGIKIILYSAHHDTEHDFKQYGADDFISKPFLSKDLIELINLHLQGSGAEV
ncbi:response regulator [Foetidibacter luteolus]|uniref:response regulator n=1 Tax=Foetidibacter luteolus TaxID=2608880 RepID=UPI00129AEBEA|nr:response regulator [Foetidibacter luteolus]